MTACAKHRLEGRTAVVTGAGRNIGRAIARRLASEGAHVVVVGRNRLQLEETADEIRADGGEAEVAIADVVNPDQAESAVAAAVRRWGRLDVLVNNAGVFEEPAFPELDATAYRTVFDTNVLGTILMSQAAARHMAGGQDGGSIIHISSVDASGADGSTTVYSASKAAVSSLGRTMAVELARSRIRVNSVAPGWVHTDLADQASPALREHMLRNFPRVPLRRAIEPAEIAATVAFLASDDASGITGTTVTVDGGLTANLYVVETLPAD